MPATGTTVLTIGHSTHPVEAFIGLLESHSVTALADVRAAPYSRFNPQFNRETLAASLDVRGIAYVFLGQELGGRSEDPACYAGGRVSYERLGATVSFRKGLDRVAQGAAAHRIALMCAEREPLECHRCLLVAPALEARGIHVAHIQPDGGLESHRDAMGRLLALHGLQDSLEEQLLFPRSLTERITEAISLQAHRFAHRNDTGPRSSPTPGRGRVEMSP